MTRHRAAVRKRVRVAAVKAKTRAATGTRLTSSSSLEDAYLRKIKRGENSTGRASFQGLNESHAVRQLRQTQSLPASPVKCDSLQMVCIPKARGAENRTESNGISETGHRERYISLSLF